MRPRVAIWPVGVIGVALYAGGARGQDSPEPRIARLVTQLANEAYAEREAAADELFRLGPGARSALESALESPDVEVRIRARKLLERLGVEELWAGTRFTPKANPVQASVMLQDLSEQTENRLLLGDRYAQFPDGSVTLPASAHGFWPALDEICRQIDSRFRAHYELFTPGLVIVSGSAGGQPVAYCGPLRAQLTSARRDYQEDLNLATGDAERQHTFQLHVEMIWEDQFKLVAYRAQPVVGQATTEDGDRIASEQPSGGAWNVVSGGAHQASATLRLHPPPVHADRLAELRLDWELIAVGDRRVIELDPRGSHEPQFQDDAVVTITSCDVDAGGRVDLSIVIGRDMPLPEPQEIVFQENVIELYDAAGKQYRKQSQSHALTADGAQYKLCYLAPSADSVPQRLNVTYPRIRSLRSLPLVFRDVPLPTGRPE